MRLLGLLATLGLCLALLMGTASAVPAPVIGPVTQGEALHVMSYNLRFAAATTPNSWAQRRPVMAELLNREQPTVLGTQEGLHHQLQDIERDLPPYYDWIGRGREGGNRGEFAAVFFDTRRVKPKESHHYWLSDTPDTAGSMSWGNNVPRMVTWVRFADLKTGKDFIVINTHFDNDSGYACTRSAELVRSRISKFPANLPVLVIGDFNNPAGRSRSYQILVTQGGMTDSWLAAEQRLTSLAATYHGYRGARPGGNRIDWILARGARKISAAAINTFGKGGQIPSDHFPVQALITL